MALNFKTLRPIQAMAASMLLRYRKLMLCLPRQFGGKTELGVRMGEDLLRMSRHPVTGLFLAKNSSARRKAAREKFLRIYDPKTFSINTEIIYSKARPANQLLMGSVDKDPDAQRGGTYNWIHWSEVAFSKLEHGVTIMDVHTKTLRPATSQTDGYALYESTNNGHNGWKDLWDNHKELGFHRLMVPFWMMLEMGLVTQEEYDKEKSETLPLVFRQEYECEFVTFAGLTYEEFDEGTHVCPVPPPETWQKVVMAIDWGWDPSATCVLFAYIKDGIVHVFDEIYAKQQRLEETHASIVARLQHWRIFGELAAVADHEEDRIAELELRGIPCSKAKKANVLGARLEIKELIWKNKFLVDPRCKYTIRDLTTAVWHEKKEGDLDYTQCTYGHFDAEAALRYLVRELKTSENVAPIVNPYIGVDDASARAFDLLNQLEEDENV
jgi:hypothetical protein